MPIFEQLEPRILLSADLIPLPVDADPIDTTEAIDETVQAPADNTPESNSTDMSTELAQTSAGEIVADSQTIEVIDNEADPSQLTVDTPAAETSSQEFIFINDDIEGFEALKEDLTTKKNSEVIILSSQEDGLTQINTALNNAENIGALHFFSHGSDSTVKLGSSWLNSSNLSENQDSISSWGEHLTEDGDILFYGCDLAASEAGESFINDIATLTGADVAASVDPTGHFTQGADWILEYETGEVESVVPVSSQLQSDWLHILAEETIGDSFDDDNGYSGNSGTVDWISDWIEIGDDDDASSGEVQISNDTLLIKPAASNETIRGITRVADLTDAASAYLSFDIDDKWGGTVSVQIRDDGGDWTTLFDDEIIWYTDATRLQFDISDYTSATTEIRFVSEGTDYGGSSDAPSVWATFNVDNLSIDYTTDTWSSALWFSTENDVGNGGQTGIENWTEADVISLNNSGANFGSTTEGYFSMAAQLSTFADGADIRSLHYVTTKMYIGDTELNVGDILFSAHSLDSASFGDINASDNDIILFSPTNSDYSAGTFSIFLDDISDKKINGITLVESAVTVGDRDLQAGDILITHDGGSEHSDIYHLQMVEKTIGLTTTVTYTPSVLIEGDDTKVGIDEKITGIDLVERTTTIGNTELQAGTILLSLNNEDSIPIAGSPDSVNVAVNDIIALEVITTSSPDGSTDNQGEVSASMFFEGEDVSFDSNDEKFDAFSLTITGEIPQPTFTSVSFDEQSKTITLAGTNLDFIGAIGTNVKDQLDWSKITWDVNGDGSTTSDITFDITNISTVLTSTTTLTINLTGDKTIEITGTEGYGEDGGTDTLTILPGFVSNESGDLATTDGLTDAPISTSTAPVGVNLSNTSIPENTDTTNGFTVGTLSTTDFDPAETHTYDITGGVDSGYFVLGGTNGDELILNDGLLDYETKSTYTVEITVTDSTGQTAIQTLTVSISDINETPAITENSLTINEDQTVTLTSSDLAATDEESIDGDLLFTVETVDGGQFENTDLPDTAITSFNQTDVADGKIIFVDDGDETAPSYSISVSDGTLTSAEASATIDFTAINDAPVINNNSLSLDEGERKTLTTTDLNVSDGDNIASELLFTVNSVSEGQFELSTDTGTAITSFTQEDLDSGYVQFVHNGGEITPAYSLSVSDGEDSFGPSNATITLTNINDTPTLQHYSLNIQEGETVLITDVQLLASDPDDNATALTYTISNPLAGKFFTTGDATTTAITSFTQDDINNGLVSFVHDGSATSPSYDVEVKDDKGASSGAIAASITFYTTNDAPVFETNILTINEGESVTLTDDNFSATDDEQGPASLIFIISGVGQGQFESTHNPGTSITSFTQADINAGKIIFKHNGGETAPSYTATVSDGLASDSLSSTINFTPVNDAPEIITNTITLSEGDTVAITSSILEATDNDDTSPSLTFTVSELSGGIFTTTADSSTAITTFTQAQITAGNIQFIHDGGEDAPEYQITVTDDDLASTTQAANVIFAKVNDAPQLINNKLIVDEGGTVTLSAASLSASDPDNISSNLTFTVETITGGQFENTSVPDNEIFSFTQGEILAGEIIFVHDGEEAAPLYEISVTDDGTPPESTAASTATITFNSINDIPDLLVNTITLSEGDTVTLDNSILAATDSDSNVPDLIFTVTNLTSGNFININDPATAITSFTQNQITNGEIRIIHDGGEDAISYSVSVSDSNLTTTAAPATVNFTGVNDAPTLHILGSNESYTEDSTHSLSDIRITDSDSGTNYEVSLKLSDNLAGILHADVSSYPSTTSVFSGGTLTVSGTNISDINSVLHTTTFSPALNYIEDFTITITATDGLNSSNPLTKNLHAIHVNDAPTASSLNQSGTYTEDIRYDLEDIVVADVDQNETISAQMTLSSPGFGTLSTAGGANFDAISGIWSISGTVTEVNNALSLVSFIPTADSLEDTTITVQIEDGKEDGATALSGTINLTGTAEADAPLISDEVTETTSEISSREEETSESEGGSSPDTGGDSLGEEITVTEEISGIDETLELVTGLETGASDADPQNEDSSSPDAEETTKETDDVSAGDASEDEDADSSLSYVNAQKIQESSSATELFDIAATFDSVTFDMSFDSASVHSFSLSSSAAPQTIKSDSLLVTAGPEESEIYSTSNYDLLDLEYRDRSFEEYQSVRKSLENFREQTEQEASIEKTVVGSAIAASTGLSAGYVIWLLRSGALLSSILSSLPAWQLADPLAVLAGAKGGDEEDDDSIESIIEKGTHQPTPEEKAQHPPKTQ
ncbi:cadherin-like domain-containing protein [Desulforhopalus sp. 52FAK]